MGRVRYRNHSLTGAGRSEYQRSWRVARTVRYAMHRHLLGVPAPETIRRREGALCACRETAMLQRLS